MKKKLMTGVKQCRNKMFSASMSHNSRIISLGVFNTEKQAGQAYLDARKALPIKSNAKNKECSPREYLIHRLKDKNCPLLIENQRTPISFARSEY